MQLLASPPKQLRSKASRQRPIKYVTLFWTNFTPPLSHFVTHLGTPSSTSHVSNPPFLAVQKPGQKSPVQNLSQLFAGVFVRGTFVMGFFVWKALSEVFDYSPLRSEYVRYNIKLNITFNFRFHMYDKKCKSVTSHDLPPLVTNCHTFSAPPP